MEENAQREYNIVTGFVIISVLARTEREITKSFQNPTFIQTIMVAPMGMSIGR